ncbi:DNA primase large subunit Spp2 [Sporothrix curviconia]|uniref:Pre-mRNA-splicing factor n=1 Tax=Sporothrix curviconia TaxID=1260050 RepID=A0ABP0BN55_9PEZI
MSASERPEVSRIEIKFGGSSSGSSKKPTRPPPPSSSLGKRSRPSHGLGGNSDSESDDDSHVHGRHERITAFGDDGAELARSDRDKRDDRRSAKRGPLTIERQANRDWRSEARSRSHRGHRQSAPRSEAEMPQAGSQKDVQPADEDKPLQWGLTLTKGTSPTDDGKGRDGHDDKSKEETNGDKDTLERETADEAPEDHQTSAEKEAVRALMGETIDDKTKTRHVIERAPNEVAEDAVFIRDFTDAPDVSTLDDYEAMPVEEFGAALLRGMGWDGKDRGPKVKQVVRRPNQLGLGAKELKGDEDLGGWNHKTGGGSSSSHHLQRPPKLHDYRREEDRRREKRKERYRDSYKSERDRDRDDRSSSSRHRSRHYR